MKTKVSRTARQLASTLLVVLVLGTILCLSVVGYLSLIEQQSALSARSQCWNVAIAIVEAGIEEGLQQLNSSSTNLAANGWADESGRYSRSQTLADGNSYTVVIDTSDGMYPTITAYATISLPNMRKLFYGAFSVPQPDPEKVSRAVRVKCARGSLFTASLVAKHDINLNGNGVYTDSYDSGDPSKSTRTKYDSTKYSGDYGDVATNGGITDSVGVQNANIYGHVHTGPNCPVTIGPKGGVGSHAWQAANAGFQPGWVLQDANFTFPDTTMPSTAGLFTPPSGTNIIANYIFDTNALTSATYPSAAPAEAILTNVSYRETSVLPNPRPAGLTTNVEYKTVSTLPNPAPAGTVTNLLTTTVTTDTYPSSGTYVGGVSANTAGNSGQVKNYTYNKITGRTYTYPVYTYRYPLYTYTVASTVTYTTNFYQNVVYANTTNYSASLTGKTYIAGPNACLVLPNGLTGSEDFTFAQGASVLIYSGGTSCTINGNQYLNPNGYAASFIVYCAPSVTSFTLDGNGQFTGVLVAPNADIAMNGGGKLNTDFCGSLMVNSCRFNGHYSFHYDEALAKGPSNGRFLVQSWDEVNPFQ